MGEDFLILVYINYFIQIMCERLHFFESELEI